jgi:4-hydroxyphenylpyruvate dioxygenase
MATREPLGIKRLEGIHYYVRDLERSRHFYVDRMDFQELGESDNHLTEGSKQRSIAFRAGDSTVICSTPLGPGGRAWRWLQKHPDGVGTLIFEVADIDRTFQLLDERGGTAIDEVERFEDRAGCLGTFSITTPFGDTTFRFMERKGETKLYPGFVPHATPRGGKNALGIERFDHVTSNFETMMPALLWLEHVLGFERFWQVQFHTDDVAKITGQPGSGLRSVVMWDEHSSVKFANNEPYRPHFKDSQINVFHEQNRGDGIQHLAIAVRDIVAAVREMRRRGVDFMPTPPAYYEMLPERIQQSGIGRIDEDIETLAELGILVDGAAPGKYLLQIFLKDSAGYYGNAEAGPFFYEIIQRKGDQGFGAGNFRALFESIERMQKGGGPA